MKKWAWYAVTIFLIALDQTTKYIALQALPLYHPKPVLPCLNWTLTFNSGFAFGFLNQSKVWWHPYILTTFGIAMSLGLIVWMALCQSKNKLELLALAFILSGALGNVMDRLRFGYVIDFIQVYYKNHYFPVFNIADSAICIGAVLLFMTSSEITRKKRVPKK